MNAFIDLEVRRLEFEQTYAKKWYYRLPRPTEQTSIPLQGYYNVNYISRIFEGYIYDPELVPFIDPDMPSAGRVLVRGDRYYSEMKEKVTIIFYSDGHYSFFLEVINYSVQELLNKIG